MKYQRHDEAESRMSSARALVKCLLGSMPGVSAEHRKECIKRVALYKITEADCVHKYRTRYMSEKAIEIARSESRPGDSGLLQHDHVLERQEAYEKLISALPEAVDAILDQVVGCTVTKDEHRLLSRKKKISSWKRYEALVPVIDTFTGERFI